MKNGIAGQSAIVTGAARGIGLGIARRLAEEGCKVAVWDRDLGPLAKAEGFTPAFAHEVDLTRADDVVTAFEKTVEALGDIQILINNAGISGPVIETWEYPLDVWDKVLAVNLTAVFYCCRVAVPHMLERGYGRIVTVSSMSGKDGMPRISAYSASKAGVIGFCKALAKETVGTGVLVNYILPVMTETELFNEMTQAHIDYCRSLIPMGRFPKIEEIAAMVCWMASPECSFNSGASFDMSGGRGSY